RGPLSAHLLPCRSAAAPRRRLHRADSEALQNRLWRPAATGSTAQTGAVSSHPSGAPQRSSPAARTIPRLGGLTAAFALEEQRDFLKDAQAGSSVGHGSRSASGATG